MKDSRHPLERAMKVASDAAAVGFDWPDARGALEKVREEADEIEEIARSADAAALREEVGDLLFAVCNVARKLDVDPADALEEACSKFERRFAEVLASVERDGKSAREVELEELERHWQRAKGLE